MPDNKYMAVSERISDMCLLWYMNSVDRGDDLKHIIQYVNLKHVRQMFLSNETVLTSLDPNKRHINIGTGVGFMEYTNKKYFSYKLDTVDLGNGVIDPMFKMCQKELNVKQDYIIKMMRSSAADDFTITNLDPFNNFNRWDNAIFNRFVPLRLGLISKENIDKFNENMKKYVDQITIITSIKDDYPSLELFPNAKITTIDDNNKSSIEYDL